MPTGRHLPWTHGLWQRLNFLRISFLSSSEESGFLGTEGLGLGGKSTIPTLGGFVLTMLTLRSTEASESFGLRETRRSLAELGTAGTGMNISYGLSSTPLPFSGVLFSDSSNGIDASAKRGSPGTAANAIKDGGMRQPSDESRLEAPFFSSIEVPSLFEATALSML